MRLNSKHKKRIYELMEENERSISYSEIARILYDEFEELYKVPHHESISYHWRKYLKSNTNSSDNIIENLSDNNLNEGELMDEAMRLARSKQKFQDNNRVERGTWRKNTRLHNTLEEFHNSIKLVLEEHKLEKLINVKIENSPYNETHVGIVQISDTHFNELISLSNNKYDFKVASQRLHRFIEETIRIFRAYNIKNVLLALTGDLINSDRRLDELLNKATSRANAIFLAVDLIGQFIRTLEHEGFNISVASVCGNESRINEDWNWSTACVSDNYDAVIFNILRIVFDKTDVKFIISEDPLEHVVNVGNKNILLLHGNQVSKDVEKSVQNIKGKYASKGIIIDYIVFGHLHSSRIGCTYSRSASLPGANHYSEKGLQLSSRSAQNLFIIDQYGNINGMKIDLQNSDHMKGFDIVKELESYNTKSHDKMKRKLNDDTIYRVDI